MDDISPELLAKIQAAFAENLKALQREVTTYAAAGDYAEEVGTALNAALKDFFTTGNMPNGTLYENIAEKVLRPLLIQDANLSVDAAVKAQTALNQAAGIGLKAQAAAPDTDRIDGLIRVASNAQSPELAAVALDAPIRTFSRAAVDDTLKKNIEFQGKAGLRPRIIRRSEFRCCEWCAKMDGVYDYPNVPNDVYRRHERCRCVVEYDPRTGKRQDVWSKKWTSPEERAKIEARKALAPDRTEMVIQTRINKGEYRLIQSRQQYLKHIAGTSQYKQYEAVRIARGQTPQSRLTVSEEDAQKLILKCSGKGTPGITQGGSVSNKEFASADRVIGQYSTLDGQWVDTRRFEIHHGKDSSHIVPVKEIEDD